MLDSWTRGSRLNNHIREIGYNFILLPKFALLLLFLLFIFLSIVQEQVGYKFFCLKHQEKMILTIIITIQCGGASHNHLTPKNIRCLAQCRIAATITEILLTITTKTTDTLTINLFPLGGLATRTMKTVRSMR